MLAPLTLVGSSGSLKVHTMVVVTGTPVALFAGLTVSTDGRVTSGVALAPVVNVLVNGDAALPATSVTGPRVTVWSVLVTSGLAGVKVRLRRSALSAALPASGGPPAVNSTDPPPTLTALSGSSKARTTGA